MNVIRKRDENDVYGRTCYSLVDADTGRVLARLSQYRPREWHVSGLPSRYPGENAHRYPHASLREAEAWAREQIQERYP